MKFAIYLAALFLAIVLAFSLVVAYFSLRSSHGEMFVSLSIILDMGGSNWVEDYYSRLESFLSACSFYNWTFCIFQYCQDAWLTNVTRLNLLKTYGVLIPRIDYAQTWALTDRSALVDAIFANWSRYVGYYPRGVFDFVPDTYVANYTYWEYNCSFYQGYCFDQYRIDYMSMRGGWQLPYYADSNNILVPKRDRGIVVFSHASWDWIDSFQTNHNLQLHPMNLIQYFGNSRRAEQYFLNMIARNSYSCNPFSLSVVQFEWGWCCKSNDDSETTVWIRHLLNHNYLFWNFEDIAEWFSNHFVQTPEYTVRFASPNSGKSIEWFYSCDYRISRVSGMVNSFVQYSNYNIDKYLTASAVINWSRPSCPNETDNQIDLSLNFSIDALGGGILRSPVITRSYEWVGDLRDFPSHYDSLKDNTN